MQITFHPEDHTVSLRVTDAELASLNDALDHRQARAVFPKAPADRLNEADQARCAELEKGTYEAYCALSDKAWETKPEEVERVPARSDMGELLFQTMVGMTEAYAAGLREAGAR